MHRFLPLLLLALLITPLSAEPIRLKVEEGCEPKNVGKRIADNLLARDGYMLYGRDGLHYAEACAALGALRFAQVTGDTELLHSVIERYRTFTGEADQFAVSKRQHVDVSMVGCVPLEIFMQTRDERYLKAGLSSADRQWESPREDGLTRQARFWIDDMYMVGILQMQAYRATNDSRYADRAALLLDVYCQKLQRENGLFSHGNESAYRWGRGNGWVAVALAEVLSLLPEDHPRYERLMGFYQKMMASLLEYQSDNGMWRQVIDYEYSWQESSCTAMFAYAMAVGVSKGWLEKDKYGPAVARAWNALCAQLDPKANMREICIGTGQVDDLDFYMERPRHKGDFHGQAPMLWLATALIAE